MDEQRERSEKCRQRIEEELAKTEKGLRIIKAQESRNQAREGSNMGTNMIFRRRKLYEEKERSREQVGRGRCRV